MPFARSIVAGMAAVLMVLSGFAAHLPARAERVVDLELVLAVDVSWSMDIDEQRLQREGYVAAFRHPEVWTAIRSGGHASIAVTYVEWAGQFSQQIVLPWTLIDSEAAMHDFADRLEKTRISRERLTSISGAIQFSARLFRSAGFRGIRRVIDVSGDGPNNSGFPVEGARDAAVRQGIVINGLPIMLKRPQTSGFFDIDHLDRYYRDCVIGGAGAFMIPVASKEEFAPAIRRKLVLEIAGLDPQRLGTPRIIRVQSTNEPQSSRGEGSDCMVGEKLWENYIRSRFREN